MPIYEYACPECGHEFETMQKVSEPRLTDCPSCDGQKLKKKVSATSFTLKGSGWYKDHYGLKSSSGSSSESSGSTSSDSASSGSSGGDTSSASTTSSSSESSE